jgi:hypothetical protein
MRKLYLTFAEVVKPPNLAKLGKFVIHYQKATHRKIAKREEILWQSS